MLPEARNSTCEDDEVNSHVGEANKKLWAACGRQPAKSRGCRHVATRKRIPPATLEMNSSPVKPLDVNAALANTLTVAL